MVVGGHGFRTLSFLPAGIKETLNPRRLRLSVDRSTLSRKRRWQLLRAPEQL
jgi:hypothetical protein